MNHSLIYILQYLQKHSAGFHVDNIRELRRADVRTGQHTYDICYVIRMINNRITIVLDHGTDFDVISVIGFDQKNLIKKLLLTYNLTASFVKELLEVDDSAITEALH